MIGHYDGALNTAMPWDKTGNFAVAAHRNTHGEPFRYINRLVPGDKVVVETSNTYYTYQITSSLASTPPSNTSVLQPIPVGSGFTTARPLPHPHHLHTRVHQHQPADRVGQADRGAAAQQGQARRAGQWLTRARRRSRSDTERNSVTTDGTSGKGQGDGDASRPSSA